MFTSLVLVTTRPTDAPHPARHRALSRVVVASLAAVVVIAAINWGLARYLDHRVAAEAACRLPEGASVRDAEVGGNTILSLIKGRFSTIVVHSQDFPVGAAAGLKDVKVDVIMEMTDVLLDRDAAFEDRIGSVDLKMGLDAATLQDLMAARPTGSSQPVPELEIRDGVLRAIVPGQEGWPLSSWSPPCRTGTCA